MDQGLQHRPLARSEPPDGLQVSFTLEGVQQYQREPVANNSFRIERAPSPKRQKRARDDSEDEGDRREESSDEEDDSEHDQDGNEKHPVYHWQIWEKLLRKGSQGGLVRYGLSLWSSLKESS